MLFLGDVFLSVIHSSLLEMYFLNHHGSIDISNILFTHEDTDLEVTIVVAYEVYDFLLDYKPSFILKDKK